MASNRGGLSSSSSTSSLEELSTPSHETKSSRDPTTPPDNQGPEMRKHEGNPFSFKHFLRKASQTNYRNAGARPKVYSPVRNTNNLDIEKPLDGDGVYTGRNPTELPDFVQDHLVIEQCYLNSDSTVSPIPSDVDNLPDFAIIESRGGRNHGVNGLAGDLPFDLTGSLAPSTERRQQHNGLPDNSETINFPLDLPVQGNLANSEGTEERSRDTNLPKSLPDFLSDGPIRNCVASQPETSAAANSSDTLDRRLLLENDQLRHDLEMARRQSREQYRRIQYLEGELSTRRAVDHQETAHLEKAMEQVEDNLKRSTRRAVNAESTVTALKQEIKALKLNISVLRSENQELRESLGTSCSDSKPANHEKKIQRFASDIRDAASSADCLLRQLMMGVDNLKVLASAMENVDRIEDRTKDFLFDLNNDDDDDDAAGPAL